MDIYRHFRALEDIVDMRFPYFGEHIPEVEISDEERKEIHMIIDEMKIADRSDQSVKLHSRENDYNKYKMFKTLNGEDKPRWVIVGGDGFIVNKNPTKEELKSAIKWTFEHNMNISDNRLEIKPKDVGDKMKRFFDNLRKDIRKRKEDWKKERKDILCKYVENAMLQAEYNEFYEFDKKVQFVGKIRSCIGVIAFGNTLEKCELELLTTLGDWILLGLKFGHTLPIIEGIELNKDLCLNPIMPNNEGDLMFIIQHTRSEKLKEVNKDMAACLRHMESIMRNIKDTRKCCDIYQTQLSKDETKNEEKEKELDSKILNFLERKKLTNTPAYAIWDIFEEIYNMKIGNKHFYSNKLVEVGCSVYRLEKCEKIVGINVKDNDITYYMVK